MAEGQVPPPAALRKGAKGSTLAVIAVIFLVIGFVMGGLAGAPLFGWVKEKTSIVVGTNTPFPPMEMRNTTNGNLEGIDIDLVNEIGTRNGWVIEWRDFQEWDALLAAVKFKRVDIGASSITMSGSVGAERNSSFDFSDPYYEADQAVLVKTGSTAFTCAASECTIDELANHTVATQTLTTSYYWVQGNLIDTHKTPDTMWTSFPSVNTVITELLNGQVDWVLVDKPIAQSYVAGNPNLRIAGTIETNELYGFAVADGDPLHLIAGINSALKAMRDDGTYAQILNKPR
jgi:polar amino acid transport system substrate-binding protein